MTRRSLLLPILGVLIALAAAPTAALAGDTLDRIAKTGVVRIGVPGNFPPFGDLGESAKLEGYDIDTAALIAEGLRARLDLVAVSSPERIAALTNGKIDLVVSTLGKTPERETQIDFSIAYAPFFSAVYGPAALAVSTPADLAGKTIGVTGGTIEDKTLTERAPAAAVVKRYDDNARTEVAFLTNETALIATGNAAAGAVLAKSPLKKTQFKFLLLNSPCYVGVAKGDAELVARVDAIIGAARKDGRLDQISQRWLKAPLGDPEHPDPIASRP